MIVFPQSLKMLSSIPDSHASNIWGSSMVASKASNTPRTRVPVLKAPNTCSATSLLPEDWFVHRPSAAVRRLGYYHFWLGVQVTLVDHNLLCLMLLQEEHLEPPYFSLGWKSTFWQSYSDRFLRTHRYRSDWFHQAYFWLQLLHELILFLSQFHPDSFSPDKE